VTDNVVYQDNQSAILLERNGQASCGKRTRHINIRYFFIKDRVANQELRIEYCPTEDMLSDLLTKPLQGSQFRKLRDRVLNINNDETTFAPPAPQECVGTSSPQDDSTKSIGSRKAAQPLDDEGRIEQNDDVAEGEWFEVKNKKNRRSKRESETEESHTLSQI